MSKAKTAKNRACEAEMKVLVEQLIENNEDLTKEIDSLKPQLQKIQSEFAVYKSMQRSRP